MKVSILSPSASPNISVGIDTLEIAKILTRNNFATCIYAIDWQTAHVDGILSPRSYLDGTGSLDRNILIYQHAIGWPMGDYLFKMSKDIKIVRYHNITPAHYFEKYSETYATACRMGEKAILGHVRNTDSWFWPVSNYNRISLVQLGAAPSRCLVVPPFHAAEHMASTRPARKFYRGGKGHGATILYVSAIRPHKGHVRALDVFHKYQSQHDMDAQLIFAGTTDSSLSLYLDLLMDKVNRLNLQNNVRFASNVSPSCLHGLYLDADVFLCMSEHEGFGLPLVEAMYFGLPIVALKGTAIPETLGEAGIVLDGDNDEFVTAILGLIRNRESARVLQEFGRARFQKYFRREVIEGELLLALHETLAAAS